jgi:hypothetical protein
MNKKQKLLTVAALVAFIAIGVCHYVAYGPYYYLTPTLPIPWFERPSSGNPAILPDAKRPWFMLGVIYTALFFSLQNKRGGS